MTCPGWRQPHAARARPRHGAHCEAADMGGQQGLCLQVDRSLCRFLGVAKLPATCTPATQTIIGLGIALGALRWPTATASERSFCASLVPSWQWLCLYLLAGTTAGLLGCLFATAFLLNAAVPSITVQMMRLAPQAPTKMGALNMAAFNIANALGAVGGAKVIAAGWGLRAPILAGLGLTCMALLILCLAFRRLIRV